MSGNHLDIAVIGGGAAGFFAAIQAAEAVPGLRMKLWERGSATLQKVRISGGGRCNVTHACFDPEILTGFYPRGGRELLGPFHMFGPLETMAWFRDRGVRLKTEADGRMFPVTDRSETIASCLEKAARQAGVEVLLHQRLEDLRPDPGGRGWMMRLQGVEYTAGQVLVATGSSPAIWKMLERMGMSIIPPVPSLFTFTIADSGLRKLSGIAVPDCRVVMEGHQGRLVADGPLLITHQGLSGPAVLRLSAFGAREMARADYRFHLKIRWGGSDVEPARQEMARWKKETPRKKVLNTAPDGIPSRLWDRLCRLAGLPEGRTWADLKREEADALVRFRTGEILEVAGKSTFKEEFVTAGGVDLKEMDFRTFGARRFPGLYLAGEVLDIDAVTGGFNFQAAWTGGWLAGKAMAARHLNQ